MVKRSILVLAATLVVVAAIAAYVVLYLTNVPDSARAAQTSAGHARLYLATVPAAEGTDPHPTWVSYYQTNDQATNWQHKTDVRRSRPTRWSM